MVHNVQRPRVHRRGGLAGRRGPSNKYLNRLWFIVKPGNAMGDNINMPKIRTEGFWADSAMEKTCIEGRERIVAAPVHHYNRKLSSLRNTLQIVPQIHVHRRKVLPPKSSPFLCHLFINIPCSTTQWQRRFLLLSNVRRQPHVLQKSQ